jgi:hypothetical protein
MVRGPAPRDVRRTLEIGSERARSIRVCECAGSRTSRAVDPEPEICAVTERQSFNLVSGLAREVSPNVGTVPGV